MHKVDYVIYINAKYADLVASSVDVESNSDWNMQTTDYDSIIYIPTKGQNYSHILSALLHLCLLICLRNKFSVRGFPQDRGQGPL